MSSSKSVYISVFWHAGQIISTSTIILTTETVTHSKPSTDLATALKPCKATVTVNFHCYHSPSLTLYPRLQSKGTLWPMFDLWVGVMAGQPKESRRRGTGEMWPTPLVSQYLFSASSLGSWARKPHANYPDGVKSWSKTKLDWPHLVSGHTFLCWYFLLLSNYSITKSAFIYCWTSGIEKHALEDCKVRKQDWHRKQ